MTPEDYKQVRKDEAKRYRFTQCVSVFNPTLGVVMIEDEDRLKVDEQKDNETIERLLAEKRRLEVTLQEKKEKAKISDRKKLIKVLHDEVNKLKTKLNER